MLSFQNFLDTSLKCIREAHLGFEIRQHEFNTIQVICKNGKLIKSEVLTDEGTGVNAIKKGLCCFIKSEKVDVANLRDMLKSAKLEDFSKKAAYNYFEDTRDFSSELYQCWDSTSIPVSEYEELARCVTERMIKSNAFIKEAFVLLRIIFRKKMYVDSRNISYYIETGEQSCSLMASASTGGHQAAAYRDVAVINNNSNFINELNIAADDVCRQSLQLLKKKSPKLPKRLPVILDPFGAGGLMHETIGHMSEAWIGEKRGYKLPELGTQLAPPCISIIDDGQYAESKGFTPIDDEGVSSVPVEILRNGVLTGWLHNRKSSGKYGMDSTGNGRAVNSLFGAIPRMRTTILSVGKHSFNDLLNDIDLGLYIKGKMCGEASCGSFSMIPYETMLIRNGALEEIIPNILLTDRIFRVLSNIDRVANDLTKCESFGGCEKEGQAFLPVSFWSPHIRISEIGIHRLDASDISKLSGS